MLKYKRPAPLTTQLHERGGCGVLTDGGGEGEGDAEPEEAAQEVAAHRGGRPRSDGALPVRLVDEDRPKGADDLEGCIAGLTLASDL